MPAGNGIACLIYSRKEKLSQRFYTQSDFQIERQQIYQHVRNQGILFPQVSPYFRELSSNNQNIQKYYQPKTNHVRKQSPLEKSVYKVSITKTSKSERLSSF